MQRPLAQRKYVGSQVRETARSAHSASGSSAPSSQSGSPSHRQFWGMHLPLSGHLKSVGGWHSRSGQSSRSSGWLFNDVARIHDNSFNT